MLSPGDRLGGYTIERHLGSGTFGDVYLATANDGDSVALKVCRTSNPEVTVLQRLQHSGIVAVIEEFQQDQQFVTVMDYVDGVTLATLLASVHRQQRGRRRVNDVPDWPLDTVDWGDERLISFGCRVVQETALALEYAHGQGVFHRDVKPENILISRHGRAVLIDWGIAAGVDTAHGMAAGTLPYMSTAGLRVAAGLGSAAAPDPTASPATDDLFALGIVLYELVVGDLPFPAVPGNSSMVAAARAALANRPLLAEKIAGRRDLPAALRGIILACIGAGATPYRDMSQLARDLDCYRGHRPLPHVGEAWICRLTRCGSRHRRLWISVLVLLLALSSGFVLDRAYTAWQLAAVADYRQAIDWSDDGGKFLPPQLTQAIFDSGLFPDSQSLTQQRVHVAHGLAAAFLQHNQPAEAAILLQRAIELIPDNGELQNDLGAANFRLRLYDRALTAFAEALKRPCDHAAVFSNRGATYAALGDFQRARQDFENALQQNPHHSAARRHLELLNSILPPTVD